MYSLSASRGVARALEPPEHGPAATKARPRTAAAAAAVAAAAATAAPHRLPALSLAAGEHRGAKVGAAKSPNSSAPPTEAIDRDLLEEYTIQRDHLVQLWDLLGVHPHARQRSIGSGVVLAVPSWTHLLRIRQLVSHLEREAEDVGARRGLLPPVLPQSMSPSADHPHRFTSFSVETRPRTAAANPRCSWSAGGYKGGVCDSDPSRQLQYSSADATPEATPPRKRAAWGSQPGPGPTLDFGGDHNAALVGMPSSTSRPPTRGAPVADASTSTDVTAVEKLERALAIVVEAPRATRLDVLLVEEQARRQQLEHHAAAPLDALFLLHCHSLMHLEEEAIERSKAHRRRQQLRGSRLGTVALISAKRKEGIVGSDTTSDDEDDDSSSARSTAPATNDNGDTENPRADAAASTPPTTVKRSARTHTSSSSSPAGVAGALAFLREHALDADPHTRDALEALLLEEEMRRLRLLARGLALPRVVFQILSLQSEQVALAAQLQEDEARCRAFIEDELKTVLTTKLDGPTSRTLHRLLYTTLYRTESEERAAFAFMLEDFTAGWQVVRTTVPAVVDERAARLAMLRELDSAVLQLQRCEHDSRQHARLLESVRQETEMHNIEDHESAHRDLHAGAEQGARAAIECEIAENQARQNLHVAALTALRLLACEAAEDCARRPIESLHEPLGRCEHLAAAVGAAAVAAEEAEERLRIPDRVNNFEVFELEMREEHRRAELTMELTDALQDAAMAHIQAAIAALGDDDALLRRGVEAEEQNARIDIAVTEASSALVVSCSDAVLRARAETGAATIIQSFGRRAVAASHRCAERDAAEQSASEQEFDAAARIVTRSVRRVASRKTRAARAAVEERRKKDECELQRLVALQRRIATHFSHLIGVEQKEGSERVDVLLEEGSERLSLMYEHRAEVEDRLFAARRVQRVVALEAEERTAVEDDETHERSDVVTSREAATSVASVIERAMASTC